MKIKKSSNSSIIIMYAAEFAMHVHHMCNTCAIAQENNRTEKWPANLHRIGRNGKEPDENEWATAGLLRTPCGVDQEHPIFGVPTQELNGNTKEGRGKRKEKERDRERE